MLKSLQKAFKVKEVRERLLYTFMMLIVIRIGSCLPIPGVDASFLQEFFTNLQMIPALGFFNAITGGSFYQHVAVCTEHYPVYHIFHHYAASDHCNSEA